jgi:cytochrome c556
MKRGAALAAALGLGAAMAAAAYADDPLPKNPTAAQKAAWARHEHFEQFGKAFGAIGAEIRKPAPDLAAVKANAATMKALSTDLPSWFPRGSGVEARPASLAKANVWTDAAGFSAAAANVQLQVSKLNEAAMGGDLAAVKAQFGPTAGACKACHDNFRAPLPAKS